MNWFSHRWDSDRGSDYIAIYISLIYGYSEQIFKILKLSSTEEFFSPLSRFKFRISTRNLKTNVKFQQSITFKNWFRFKKLNSPLIDDFGYWNYVLTNHKIKEKKKANCTLTCVNSFWVAWQKKNFGLQWQNFFGGWQTLAKKLGVGWHNLGVRY